MRLLRRLAYWLRFRANERELREEIDLHRELAAAEQARRGVPPALRRDAARRAMGNETYMREEARGVWLWPRLDALVQDWRYAWRGLLRSPAFTVVAVASLAIGIGANAAIFGLLDQLLLARLPVPAARDLVGLERDLGPAGRDDRFSHDEFVALSGGPLPIAMVNSSQQSAEIDGVGTTIGMDAADGGYFDLLELRPERGRLFSRADDAAAAPVVVVGDRFWRGRLAGDPAVVGRTIKIGGQPFTVIGVAAPGFAGVRFPALADVTVPYHSAASLGVLRAGDARRPTLTLIARRPDSESIEHALDELVPRWNRCCAAGALVAAARGQPAIAGRLAFVDVSRGVQIQKLDLRGQFKRILVALMAGVGVLLLAACANVANLLLARGSARTGELAVRLAIGASRARVVGQLVVESLQLSLLGATAGLLLARWGTALLVRAQIGDLARVVHNETGAMVVVFTVVVSVVSGLLFGAVPAVRVMRSDLVTPLKQSGRRAASGRRGLLDRALVALQMALALLLVSGATLLVETLRNLQSTDLGFDPAGRAATTIETRRTVYERHGMTASMADEMLRRVRAVPGVRVAAFGSVAPVYGGRTTFDNVRVRGAPAPADGNASTLFAAVTPDYFTSLGIPLLAGHDVPPPVDAEPPGAVREVVVNELFAKKFFPGGTALGRVFEDADGNDTTFTENRIIGVVGNAKFADPRADARPMYFVPVTSGDWPFLVLVIRQSGTRVVGAKAARAAAAAAPGIGWGDPVTLASSIDGALARERIAAALASLFGAIALSLVAVGLYGVMLFQVAERSTEIGIRMALGAGATSVLRLVLRQSLSIVGVGVVVGVPLALAAGRAVASQLYGVPPYDGRALGFAAGSLVAVALVATLVPARRAVAVDPLTALRAE